jgi:hypothetical protein
MDKIHEPRGEGGRTVPRVTKGCPGHNETGQRPFVRDRGGMVPKRVGGVNGSVTAHHKTPP